MSTREELIVKYAADLKDKCGVTPDMDLLTKVTIGCGPSIYNADAATVAKPTSRIRHRKKQLYQEVRLTDGADLDAGIDAVMENTVVRTEVNTEQ